MMAYYKGKEVMVIGVYRTDHDSAAEAADRGMHGNISTVGYSASAIRDCIDMGDAVRSAWVAPDECAYAICTDDGQWHTLEDSNDLLDDPTIKFKVCYEETVETTVFVRASTHEQARDIANAAFQSGKTDKVEFVSRDSVDRITWCDHA